MSLRGILNYNENKVEEGDAELIFANHYPMDIEQLSFQNKLECLQMRADLNGRANTKAVHISLNFSPDEQLTDEDLIAITERYMRDIGFEEQPFLVYRHDDAAHQHVHIASTIIDADGKRMETHNIGKNVSSKVREQIEKDFGLVPAKGRKPAELQLLKPADLQKAIYGKSETKATISNIVRCVFKCYKFTSLPEFNAVLNQFNVIADRGREGTTMYEKEGLVYSLLDHNMQKIGVPIKASAIYDTPTLKKLKEKFEKNKEKRLPYRARICELVEDILRKGVNKNELINELAARGINLVFYQNNDGKIYGLSYIDNKTCCVFNGNDLGKTYTAKRILERLQTGNDNPELLRNKQLAETIFQKTDFSKGVQSVLAQWAAEGIIIDTKRGEDGGVRYLIGHYTTSKENFFPINYKMMLYLQANQITLELSDRIEQKLLKAYSNEPGAITDKSLPISSDINYEHCISIIEACFSIEQTGDYLSKELLAEAKRKKKRRRY